MRPCNNLINTPPTLGSKGSEKATEGRHPLGFLLSGPGAIRSGRQSPPGGPDSASRFPRRYTLPFIALLAALTLGLLFLLPGGLLQAQDNGPIMYAENGTDPVATFTAVDPEGDAVNWMLAGADLDDFTIVGGVLAFAAPPDFEAPADTGGNNTYEVTITASDGTDNSDAEDVAIQVTNVDEPGTVTLSTLQPQVEVELTATLSDSDVMVDGTLTWMWFRGSSVIAGAVGATYTPMPGDVGSILKAKATYMDGEDAENDKTAEAASVHAVRAKPETNIAPAFPTQGTAGTAQTREVAENTPSGRNIGAPVVASDSGDVLTYSIDATDDQTFDIDRATGQLKTQAPLNADSGGTTSYGVTVTATDPFGAMAMAEVTITVTGVDEDPSITTDMAKTAISFVENVGIGTPLDTYGATDPEGLAISWDVSGPDAGKFEISEEDGALTFEAQPNFETPEDSNGDNVYEVTVVASDPARNSDELDVRVTVTNVAELGEITFSSRQPKVGAALTATLTDADGSITDLKWQWSSSESQREDAFEDATSDTYTPVAADVQDTLTVTATYRDGSLAAEAAAITLAQAHTATVAPDTDNKAPRFLDDDEVITSVERTIAENTAADMAIGEAVEASDPMPAGTTLGADELTYTLGGADAASFDINDGTGQLMTKAALDHETKQSYTVTVTATDPGGLSATVTVTIEVAPLNEAPVIDGEAPEEYAENGRTPVVTFTASDPERATIIWTLTGVDAADFTIVGGVLAFAAPPDFEAPADTGGNNIYGVTVNASDGTNSDTEDVDIEVTNVDEPGTVTLSTLQPQVGVELTATLSDSDVASGTPTWMWFRGSSVIVNAINPEYTPVTGDVGSKLKAKATYRDAEDAEKDKNAEGSSARSVRSVPASGNTVPAFPDQNPSTPTAETAQTREVAENTPSGRNIGARVIANDPGDVLTYSIDATAERTFDIDRATGQLKTQAPLNAEGPASYTVTVTATDPFGIADTAAVTITVTDVDEDPSITTTAEADTAISFNEDTEAVPAIISTALRTYEATDPEGLVISWDVSGPDAGKFEISGGALTFGEQPNFETPRDSNGDNIYEVTVVASDPARNSDALDVRVTVTDEAEVGTITFSSRQPKVGAALTATLTDPDGSITDLEWQWSKGESDIADETSDTYTPVADDVPDMLMVTATYRDGSLAAEAEDLMLPSDTTLAVAPDTDNKAPRFLDGDEVVTTVERNVEENTEANTDIGAVVMASDPALATQLTPDVLTYTLGGVDAASFAINDEDGQLQTKAALDHETKQSYTVTVTATDPGGLSATVTVTIEVTNENEAPEIMRGGLAISGMSSIDYAENGMGAVGRTYMATGPDAAMATWTLGGDDAGDFMFSGGMLTFRSSPDYENPMDADMDNVYMVTIMADDGTYMDTHDVMVMVTNVDEMGEVTLWAGMDALTMAPQVGDTITGAVMDPDGNPGDMPPIAMDTTINDVTWQWSRTMDTADMSSWMDIEDATGAAYMVTADDVGYYLRVMATYTDAVGTDMAMEYSPATMMVTTMMTVPMFESETGTRVVAENTAADTGIGDPVTATDADGDTLIYTLGGTDAASFGIGSTTGQLMTKAALDYEAKASYEVTVTATDPGDLSDSIDVTITVTNVDEIGTVSGPESKDYMENGMEAVGTYTVTGGSMSDMAALTLMGDDAGDFMINGGMLTFNDAPDFEAPADADGDNTYMVTVMASAGGEMDTQDVMVRVTNVVEMDTEVGDTLLDRYDDNKNGQIDRPEVLAAIRDFVFNQTIERDDVVDVIRLFVFGR